MSWQRLAFILLIFITLFVSPPIALALGLIAALTFGNPYSVQTNKITKYLLHFSVVLLGFGINLTAIYKAGKDGVLFTIATIFGTLILGYFVGKFLKVNDKTSSLISAGTAICGGSAIAAVAPAINAESDEISVSLGTVFILNSVALFIFPIIGHSLDLTQNQFGVWSAIAIHDTSSVVGTSSAYGPDALVVATTVKLARALWIAPVALFFLMLYRRSEQENNSRIAIPWFIFLFLLASVIRTYAPPWIFPSVFDSMVNLAKAGMAVTLFLIGASLSRETIRNVGFRPLIQGIFLWTVISVISLIAIMRFLHD